ncbi:MLP-like protein 34 [Salvia miltiorrhiza]|uniref:MLP-like protein 34 n=1 Tax=Salvia miltiorrhiza TaxID=226208 RepID=UPI0025ACCD98|nr:MLP-like protein 34 [Salvia miltiorrhiza]
MAQLHKLELQTLITSSPHKFFDIYHNKTYLMPTICPDKLQSVQVLQGDGKNVGSVRLWTYVMGVPVIAKDKIVGVDEVNKSITFELIDGEVTKYYKRFVATLEAEGVNTVKWSLEYEKASEDVPHPHSHLQFLGAMATDIDAYLLKTKIN